MNTKELQYFKMIADEKSISRAAKKLFIAQPSLSQYVKRIEESLGVQLFNRTSTGLNLTYAGERYYLMATQILKVYENFEFEISDINHLRTGHINIGITRLLGACLLPKVLPCFHSICPNIEISISEVTSILQEEQLLAGKLDFSLMHSPLPEDRNKAINYEPLASDPFLIAIPMNSPLREKARPLKDGEKFQVLDLKELQDEPFIMTLKGQRIRQVSDRILRSAGIINPKIFMESSTLDTVLRCVAVGLGVTLVPMRYMPLSNIDIPPKYYAIPPEYNAYWNQCIATQKDLYLSKASILFIRLVREFASSYAT